MSFKVRLILFWLLASLVAGVATRPISTPLTGEASGSSLAGLSGSLGQGITLAALGGYRNVAANFVWISMYGDWQYKRKAEVLEKMRLAVSLNPESLYFWLDGARVIANDMPVWEVGEPAMERLFDESDREGIAIRDAYAERALLFLADVPATLEQRYEVPLERGIICWQRLKDLDRAIPHFETALKRPEAPYFLSRVYVELLYSNGQLAAAYEYLKSHYAQLPDDDRRAMKPFVARRLAELEQELAVRD